MEKVLEETSMNKNILYKVTAELKQSYDFNREGELYVVTKKNGGHMSEKSVEPNKIPNYLVAVLTLLQEKVEAGTAPTETGRSVSGFRASISMLRNLGYRIDFKDNRYYFKGQGEYSLCYTKGFPNPKKVWGKHKDTKPAVEQKPVERKPIEPKPPLEVTAPAGNPFTVNYEVLEHSLKGAPRNYISFVKGLVKKVQIANNAYAALACAQTQITNMNGILSKAGN
jgi:hypothetical protein